MSWDLVQGKIKNQFKAHSKSVSSLDYHPHKEILLTASYDGTAHVWENI